MKSNWLKWLSLAVFLGLLLGACTTTTPTEEVAPPPPTEAPAQPPAEAAIDCMGASSGDEVSVIYQWSGAEEEKINAIFAPFVEECGVSVVSESTRDEAVLDTRVQSDPPDVLFWPSTTPSLLYTEQMQDLASIGAHSENYADFWIDQGTVSGNWLVLPAKADIKTIVWYSPVQFETFGYSVPTTFDELDALVEQMVADGNTPWSMGMGSGAATGWTGSDFIQDVLLVQQGPEYVMGLIDGSISYDDAGVVQAYETYAKWAADDTYTVGGATGTVETSFLDAIFKVYSDPAEAMMVNNRAFALYANTIQENLTRMVDGHAEALEKLNERVETDADG